MVTPTCHPRHSFALMWGAVHLLPLGHGHWRVAKAGFALCCAFYAS